MTKLSIWVVVDPSITHVFCSCRCAYQEPHLHIYFDLLITKNENIKSFVRATMMKLCKCWFVVNKFAYLIIHLHVCSDWLVTKKSKYPGLYMCYSDETWWVVVGTSNIDPLGLSSLPMHIINIWFAHFFWLANDNKGKYLEGCIVGWSEKNKSFWFLFWIVIKTCLPMRQITCKNIRRFEAYPRVPQRTWKMWQICPHFSDFRISARKCIFRRSYIKKYAAQDSGI